MELTTIGLSFLAGMLSTLSPCVLPLVPVLLSSASGEHRLGPAALAVGIGLSFTTIGLIVATIGIGIGLDLFRGLAASFLVALGIVLLIPALQERFAVTAGPIGGWIDKRLGGVATGGLRGQLTLGLLLGAVWSPCVGPTLGAATVLAGQGEALGEAAAIMTIVGVGAAMPLLALAAISRKALARLRPSLTMMGRGLRATIGAALIAVGGAVVSGLDKKLEAMLLDVSPEWLTRLTTIL